MRIRVGFDLAFECLRSTPMMAMLRIHPARHSDLVVADALRCDPPQADKTYCDGFGNLCSRVMLPAGSSRLWSDAIVQDSGLPDEVRPDARQHAVEELPDDTLVFLLGSRYCETDLLSNQAWTMFGGTPEGWARVQAICDFVHGHIAFDYGYARPTRTAAEALAEGRGVCRDFAHLAVALCRCMNIPARYCTGYLGDIGVPPAPEPMDFSAWFEVYLDGRWFTFDARHNTPRIGRVLMARGRDAADVALTNTFGPNTLSGFKVWCDAVEEMHSAAAGE